MNSLGRPFAMPDGRLGLNLTSSIFGARDLRFFHPSHPHLDN